jgi:hypothetical protein
VINDDYFDKLVADFLPQIETATKEELPRVLRLIFKEVERDTRQQAASMANELALNIHNMGHRW